jgi:hypothetical protein
VDDIERDGHGRDHERREIVGVVVVEIAKAPRIGFTQVETHQHYRRIDGGRRQIGDGQALDVADAPDTGSDHQEHQDGLDEVADQQVETGADHDCARRGQRHPGKKRHGVPGSRHLQATHSADVARVGQEQHDRQRAHQRRRTHRTDDWKQLVHAADRDHHVPRDADHQRVPCEVRFTERWRGDACRTRAPRRCGVSCERSGLAQRGARPRQLSIHHE